MDDVTAGQQKKVNKEIYLSLSDNKFDFDQGEVNEEERLLTLNLSFVTRYGRESRIKNLMDKKWKEMKIPRKWRFEGIEDRKGREFFEDGRIKRHVVNNV